MYVIFTLKYIYVWLLTSDTSHIIHIQLVGLLLALAFERCKSSPVGLLMPTLPPAFSMFSPPARDTSCSSYKDLSRRLSQLPGACPRTNTRSNSDVTCATIIDIINASSASLMSGCSDKDISLASSKPATRAIVCSMATSTITEVACASSKHSHATGSGGHTSLASCCLRYPNDPGGVADSSKSRRVPHRKLPTDSDQVLPVDIPPLWFMYSHMSTWTVQRGSLTSCVVGLTSAICFSLLFSSFRALVVELACILLSSPVTPLGVLSDTTFFPSPTACDISASVNEFIPFCCSMLSTCCSCCMADFFTFADLSCCLSSPEVPCVVVLA
mmetsp:Transcript_26312/g.49359  ORF Transcript_26312/g.49359 Transcript_26312/m.49359 type:complete len:328 (+) Transcript_26312:224-1207(+)